MMDVLDEEDGTSVGKKGSSPCPREGTATPPAGVVLGSTTPNASGAGFVHLRKGSLVVLVPESDLNGEVSEYDIYHPSNGERFELFSPKQFEESCCITTHDYDIACKDNNLNLDRPQPVRDVQQGPTSSGSGAGSSSSSTSRVEVLEGSSGSSRGDARFFDDTSAPAPASLAQNQELGQGPKQQRTDGIISNTHENDSSLPGEEKKTNSSNLHARMDLDNKDQNGSTGSDGGVVRLGNIPRVLASLYSGIRDSVVDLSSQISSMSLSLNKMPSKKNEEHQGGTTISAMMVQEVLNYNQEVSHGNKRGSATAGISVQLHPEGGGVSIADPALPPTNITTDNDFSSHPAEPAKKPASQDGIKRNSQTIVAKDNQTGEAPQQQDEDRDDIGSSKDHIKKTTSRDEVLDSNAMDSTRNEIGMDPEPLLNEESMALCRVVECLLREVSVRSDDTIGSVNSLGEEEIERLWSEV